MEIEHHHIRSPIPTMMNYHEFSVRHAPASELKKVRRLAHGLLRGMCTTETQNRIAQNHLPDVSSRLIQAVIEPVAVTLGFRSEANGLFEGSAAPGLRPDYYFKMPNGRGIILEVERGATLSSNADLVAYWKCHICSHAKHLFLVVPNERQSRHGRPTKVFYTVCRRLSTFFDDATQGGYTSDPEAARVQSVHIFGF